MTKRYLKTPEEVIQALRDKKEVFDLFDNNYKLVNGIIIYRTQKGGWGINAHIGCADKLYVDETESLKLEVGKFYKTRCGKKAIVLGKEDVDDGFPIHVALMNYYANAFYVSVSGRYNIDGSDNELDLIGPWED